MKKKIGILIGFLIFMALLTVNKRIVDQNAIITRAESDSAILSEDEEMPNNDSNEGDKLAFIEKIKDKIDSITGKDKEEEEENYDNKIKISLVGDILFDGHIRNHIKEHGYDYPWDYVREYFDNDDISIGNLETSVTRGGTPWPNKQFNFRSDPENIEAMKGAGIDLVSLANNHTLDYGYDGLEDTINHLNRGDIKLVGAGGDIEEATKAIIIEKDKTKIGILGYSRVAPDVGWWPNADKAGVASAYDKHIDEVLENIKETKKEVDLLIMVIHWGKELHEVPREDEVIVAKKMIDMGVDVIAGHHPHVLQGIEIYKGKPIFYSLGNFIFGSRSELSSDTMIAQLNLNHKDIESIDIIPFHIKNNRPENINEEKKREKLEYLRKISSEFGTEIDKDGKIYINEYE